MLQQTLHRNQGQKTDLIIDGADLLKFGPLEAIRPLTNFRMGPYSALT